MAYELNEIGYAYDALEPVIDKETMELHHTKHHQTYVNNLNKAIEGLDLGGQTIEEVLKNLDQVPADRRQAVRNHGGGHANHVLFWESMKPGGATAPEGELAAAMDTAFGSFAEFKTLFENAGSSRFGSGWVWLVLDKGELKVVSTPNQDSPLSDGAVPLLGNDVWEHAYYLKYQNRRGDYLKAWWSVVNWDVVAERFAAAK
ncbi:MAG: superoxide dismutase [Clostridiaceae bacterium]|nr:superoxide dismutase [Clostridiaceae bacterium]